MVEPFNGTVWLRSVCSSPALFNLNFFATFFMRLLTKFLFWSMRIVFGASKVQMNLFTNASAIYGAMVRFKGIARKLDKRFWMVKRTCLRSWAESSWYPWMSFQTRCSECPLASSVSFLIVLASLVSSFFSRQLRMKFCTSSFILNQWYLYLILFKVLVTPLWPPIAEQWLFLIISVRSYSDGTFILFKQIMILAGESLNSCARRLRTVSRVMSIMGPLAINTVLNWSSLTTLRREFLALTDWGKFFTAWIFCRSGFTPLRYYFFQCC